MMTLLAQADSITVWLPLLSLLVQLVIAVAAGVWVVATIRGTTDQLRATIGNLATRIAELKQSIDKIETRTWDHEVRLRLIEAPPRKGSP